ncbi:MAG TPA: hypothetical protein PLZ36_16000 [Armatimonadota bacterium]|nr:hypothetical protein [Armatimonadota bacterium]
MGRTRGSRSPGRSYRTRDTEYRIGYAESADGETWERKPSGLDVSADGWDAEMVEYALVLKEPERYVMLYTGSRSGRTGTGIGTCQT